MITISVMTGADRGFATKLGTEEEWGYLEEDFRRLMYFESEGCFVAWRDNERVGIITTTSYEDYAFLGSLIVRKEERGRGIGEALLQHAINHLMEKGVKTVELDGVFPAVSLYRRLGFKDKYLSLRLQGEGRQYGDELPPYSPEMAGQIVSFDREKTGLCRERIVRRLLEEFPDSVYVLRGERVTAYAVIRPRAGGYFSVGPWIAGDRELAELLLRSIGGKYAGKALAVGVPETNRDAIRILVGQGFHYLAPSLRMYLGEQRDYETNVYGIIAPEKG